MSATFKSLGSLLDNAIDVHHRSGPLYEGLQQKTSDPRHKQLLAQMADNEARMATLLQDMVGRTNDDILDTRLQYTRELNPQEFIASISPETNELSLEQIGRLGEQLHGYLIDLLQGARQAIPAQEGNELLQDLIQLEEAEGRSFSRKTNAAYEM